MKKYEEITLKPLSSAIGAEIGNVDISEELPEKVVGEIRQALLEYLVVFFEIKIYPILNTIDALPNISVTSLFIQILI